jgi:Rieske Fe-S protein
MNTPEVPTGSSPVPTSSASSCAGCARLDRRGFLQSASLLSLGALVTAACGDGVISGPSLFPLVPDTPVRFDPRQVTALQTVGGRVVVTNGFSSPVLVERISASQYRALSLVCPHRGTVVNVEADGFFCPNHEARFAADGTWIGGQSTASLPPLNVTTNTDGTLNIGGVPSPASIALSTRAAVFTTTVTGAAMAPQTVSVTNAGGGLLTGLQLALTYGANERSGWLAVQIDQTTAPATITLTATRGTLPAGTYSARVDVSAPGVASGTQSIAVSLLVQDPSQPAALQLSTFALAFSGPTGTTIPSQTVQVINAGGGSLSNLSVGVAYGSGGTGWLSATLSQTTAPATLTVRPVITSLNLGTYTATITVSATGVPSRAITVSLTVTGAGLIVTIAAWPALANVGGVAGSVGNVNGGPVAVARISATTFAAFSMRCPHEGTTIGVVNGTSFRCPNHGATFGSNGALLPNSPFRTGDLVPRTVTWTPGDATLMVT